MLLLRGLDPHVWSPVGLAVGLLVVWLSMVVLLWRLLTGRDADRWVVYWVVGLALVATASIGAATLTLRNTKGSALTFTELDNNFKHLQALTYERVIPSEKFDVGTGGCTPSAPQTIPAAGGATHWLVFCAATGDIFYTVDIPVPNDLPSSTGAFTVTGIAYNTAAAPNGDTLDFDIDAQCRRSGDASNNTWSTTPQTLAIPFVTGDTDKMKSAITAAITANGSCTGGTNTVPVRLKLRATRKSTTVCSPSTDCGLESLTVNFVGL
jgi:hypothetical protein